jgi:hypothetical protein
MNKIWISFNFYLLVVINIIAVQNPISKWMIAAIILDIVFFPIIKNLPNDKLYEIMGITWLQKKYKNNKVIMEMTKE